MIAWILRLLSGGMLNSILSHLDRRVDAGTERERIAADLAKREIEAEQDARRGAREIRLATAGFWEMRLLTFLIACPFVVHLWAVGLDTLFRFGWRIPAFPEPFNEWQGAILLSFFGIYVAGKGVNAIAAAIALRGR